MNADLENKFRDLLNTMRNPHGGNESVLIILKMHTQT